MKRVAVYCRVSTDREDQVNSFESQQQYFKKYIEEKNDWKLYKIYADEGVSGTNTKKRKAFNQMIEDANCGCFDFIITKEVSRFARNTVDTLKYTRQLKQKGVYVHFILDHIDTIDPDAELRLTIMASIAQEESRKISERVKWGQKRRMEQGVVFGRDMLGYDVRGGKLYVNPEGAKIVQLIYYKFLEEEKGMATIAREMKESGILTMTNQKNWNPTTILRILQNEKYCGDLIQKKTFTPDYLTHQKKYNRGEEQKVILHNHHTPIITREQFERAKKELKQRSVKRSGENMTNQNQVSKHTSSYPLSGKIKCGCCGASFVSRMKKRGDGTSYQTWRCYEVVRYGKKKQEYPMMLDVEDKRGEVNEKKTMGGCSMGVQIQDRDFMNLIQRVIRQMDKENITKNIIRELMDELEEIVKEEGKNDSNLKSQEEKIHQIQKKREKLIELFLSESISKEEYEKLMKKYKRIQEEKVLEWKAQQKVLRMEEEQLQSEKNEEFSLVQYNKENACLQMVQGKNDEKLKEIKRVVKDLITGQVQDGIFYRNILEGIVVNGREEVELRFQYVNRVWKESLKINKK